jgi:N utilization substance protein B
LYAAQVGGVDPDVPVAPPPPAAPVAAGTAVGRSDEVEFTQRLVRGVAATADGPDGLDAWIADAAENWTIDRMPPVDLTILRMALYELRDCPDVPPGATINEAVELAKCYSTTDSSRFVNGLLGRLAVRAGRVVDDVQVDVQVDEPDEVNVDDAGDASDGDVTVDDGPGS